MRAINFFVFCAQNKTLVCMCIYTCTTSCYIYVHLYMYNKLLQLSVRMEQSLSLRWPCISAPSLLQNSHVHTRTHMSATTFYMHLYVQMTSSILYITSHLHMSLKKDDYEPMYPKLVDGFYIRMTTILQFISIPTTETMNFQRSRCGHGMAYVHIHMHRLSQIYKHILQILWAGACSHTYTKIITEL
jgi:hypothetical protein